VTLKQVMRMLSGTLLHHAVSKPQGNTEETARVDWSCYSSFEQRLSKKARRKDIKEFYETMTEG
jgi:hypothetical protein